MQKRIYAARRPEGLDRYVGKDVWVKVHIKNPYCYSFIRILSEDDDIYTFNEIEVRRLSKDNRCHCSESYKEARLRYTYKRKKYDVQLMQPVEVLSTEELFEIEEPTE